MISLGGNPAFSADVSARLAVNQQQDCEEKEAKHYRTGTIQAKRQRCTQG